MSDAEETVWRGKFIEVRKRGKWEYAARPGEMPGVVVLAVQDGAVLLVEQYRVPLGKNCLEMPAGLVGDLDSGETVELAAARELEEETGYRADRVESLGEFYSSPGMVTERIWVVRATGLTKVAKGGGDESEDIVVHRVPLREISAFVAAKRRAGVGIDMKLLLLLAADLLI